MNTTKPEITSELSTRIQDHLSLVDSELAGVAEASELIRNYTRTKLAEVSDLLESSDDQEDSLFEQIDESDHASVKWDFFMDGACRAHNEATDHLLEQDQLLERLDDYMGSAQEPETEATAVTA
jgi:hypothetical protein